MRNKSQPLEGCRYEIRTNSGNPSFQILPIFRSLFFIPGYSLTQELSATYGWCKINQRRFSLITSNHEDPDAEYESVSYKKVYLDDDEDAEEVDQDQDGRSTETSANQQDGEDQHCSDDSYRYSEDHESYSEDSEHDDTTNPEKGGE